MADASIDSTTLDASADTTGGAHDGGSDAGPDSGPIADPSAFAQTDSLHHARSSHTATLLEDGRVLVVGGERVVSRNPLATAELFDPTTETWSDAAEMPTRRSNHQAVRLPSGEVLVVGGGRAAPVGVGSGIDVLDSALLYDSTNDRWTEVGAMADGRSHFGAALLPSGRVLVFGGTSGEHTHGSECTGAPNCGPIGDSLASAEVYDPATQTFSATGSLAHARTAFAHVVLANGDVAVLSGVNDYREGQATTEVYNEARGTWVLGPALASEARLFHDAARLPSGQVLMGGGKLADVRILSSTELLDFSAESAAIAAPLAVPHTVPRFTTLSSGRVLSTGGFHCPSPCAPINNAQIYDEATGVWSSLEGLGVRRAAHTATRLQDGRVLIAGGYSSTTNLSDCELSTLP